MKPIIFPVDAVTFTTNGIGRLDPVSCYVTEERNGQFELEAVVSIDDPHYSDLKEGIILYARHDDSSDKQPFEIYKISRPINGKVTVFAHHITYRTAKMTVVPFSAADIEAALRGLGDNAIDGCPFTFWTDKDTEGNFSVSAPVTLRSRLAENEGSILDVYGTGEYEWDHFRIKLHLHRGRDSGVVVKYGKNITDIKKVTDATNLWTGICPYWAGTDTETEEEILVMLPEQVLYSSVAEEFPYKMVVPLDLSTEFQEPPTVEQLRQRALKYIETNALKEIPTSIDVSFIALWQTEEYKEFAELQRLRLCDTLTVQYTRLGIRNTARIVKTKYNVLLERYDSLTIGETKTNLGSYS